MADDRTRTSTNQSASRQTNSAVAPQRGDERQASGLQTGFSRNDPFSLLVDRIFQGFGMPTRREFSTWTPRVDISQQGNEIIVRADLPGMDKKDIDIEIDDDMLILRGERRDEREQDENGWVRTEVNYGSFVRSIPLPEGTIADSAKASFTNGVLEVRLQAPPDSVRERRRVQIS